MEVARYEIDEFLKDDSDEEIEEGENKIVEMNRDHSVIFETASEYCILDSFVDYDGYSISSKGFLPTVVDIMVI